MNKIKYAITSYSQNKDNSVNASVIVIDDVKYEKFLFQYANITFSEIDKTTHDDSNIGIWFECSPIYMGDETNLTEEMITELNEFSKVLLIEIVNDTFESYEKAESD